MVSINFYEDTGMSNIAKLIKMIVLFMYFFEFPIFAYLVIYGFSLCLGFALFFYVALLLSYVWDLSCFLALLIKIDLFQEDLK